MKEMAQQTAEGLTLDELSGEVARELESRGLIGAHADGRVAAVPDARTIRYYTTLGLLDRPTIDARQARYGRRHVLQLLAVKALQAGSMPLAEIQARLYGRSEAELEAVLDSLAARRGGAGARAARPPSARPIVWREVTVEPGLKILADESWAPPGADSPPGATPDEESALLARLRAALDALRSPSPTADTEKERTL